ncbi:MAG TPA: hypothetical protein VIY73_24835 [Polyangiaceae bacterium]
MRKWAAFAAVLAVAACDDVNVHILSGQLYVPQDQCIEESTGIDVVNGPSTGDNCAPTCLSIESGDATSVYITTMCPPIPGDYTIEAQDAATDDADPCTGAFAAYESEAGECPAVFPEGGEGDGGDAESDAGPPPADAATEASDATPSDAGAGDASGE